MRVTTTHDPEGGGHPRLVHVADGLVAHRHREDLEEHHALSLRQGLNTVGSDEDCDLRLPGLAGCHVHILRMEDDRYVLVNVSGSQHTRVHGRHTHRVELHSGARIELGSHTLTFQRAEFADHGRPNGGRQGGELSAGDRISA